MALKLGAIAQSLLDAWHLERGTKHRGEGRRRGVHAQDWTAGRMGWNPENPGVKHSVDAIDESTMDGHE